MSYQHYGDNEIGTFGRVVIYRNWRKAPCFSYGDG